MMESVGLGPPIPEPSFFTSFNERLTNPRI